MSAAADAALRAAGPQPLWALVPPGARARYLRRTAQALLDEVEALADLLAAEAGVPRTEALLAELLPSVAGLDDLADDGPDALGDRRLGRHFPLNAGRRATLFQAPAGVVGIRGGDGSPWAEPVLEAAAALLAGNGVVLAPAVPAVGERLTSLLARAGLPDGLLQVIAPEAADDDLEAACDRVVATGLTGPKGAMLVLEAAPLDRTVSAALWAAFSRAGHGPASVGRIVSVPSTAEALVRALEAGARRLKVGDPRAPDTEVGPLPSPEQVEAVEALVREAEAGGALRLCGGPLGGALFAPVVLRGVPRDARVLTEPVPGPVLAIVEAGSEGDAIELARPQRRAVGLPAGVPPGGAAPTAGGWAGESAPAISVWTDDRAHGERVARVLGAELTWVNAHGVASPAPPVRLARHTAARQLASQSPRLRSARWLPYDPGLVRASEGVTRVLYGRQSERLAALRSGGPAFARVAWRMLRETRAR
jgi:acyl-CoA reductase-like NAD-dependent aldehyde dehydrogenase